MHLIQILLPLNDDAGRRFPAKLFERLARELTENFGGATSCTRSPAEGRWKSGHATERDDIAVIEVMAETKIAVGGQNCAETLNMNSIRMKSSYAASRPSGCKTKGSSGD